MQEKSRDVVALVLLLVLCYGAAGLGGLFSGAAAGEWYAELAKPAWTPPGWLFGPVWTVLYGMMAVSAWLVWRSRRRRPVTGPMTCFGIQLALNAAWSPLFFGLHNPGASLVDIVLLWAVLVVTLVWFLRRRLAAGWLLAPYLLWGSFATALNAAIWRLNR